MIHAKIIKRKDGSRVRIKVSFHLFGGREFVYDTSVQTCGKGKRKWRSFVDVDDHQYRALSMEEREIYKNKKELEVVTKEEVLESKVELWNSLMPN